MEEGLGKLWVSQSQKGGQRNSLIGYAGWGQMAKLANQLIRGLAMKTRPFQSAGVAKLVDAPGLGPGLARGGGSSPLLPTKQNNWLVPVILFCCGLEQEGGRGNTCLPVEEGMGKPWVSQGFESSPSNPKTQFP